VSDAVTTPEVDLTPIEAAVSEILEAEHLRMSMWGVQKPGAVTITSAVQGVFCDEVSTRLEAMRFIESNRRR